MKISKRYFTAFLCTVIIMLMFSSVTAAQSPYNSFTYDLENHAIAAPEAARFHQKITAQDMNIGAFNEPTDICSDQAGNLYIVDKGNNRIVKTDRNGRFIAVIDSFTENGQSVGFAAPEGITVTHDGSIYICDTGNARIVELDNLFALKRIITAPKSAALGKEFIFTPVRVAVDSLGRIYVVSRNFNSGIIELTKTGKFNQIFGSVDVQYNLADILWRMVSTKAQRQRSVSLVPNEYSSICADELDFIYACSAYFDSSTSYGTVKRLNALGKSVLYETPNQQINRYAKGTYGGTETYVDICSLGNEMYALLDNTRGRVFVYNNDGDLLFEFGGKGDYAGTFGTVSALTYFDGSFYIVDSRNDSVSQFLLTDYANLFIQAAEFHESGDYESENSIWERIYRLNNNSICTIRNFGRVNLREGDYSEAMRYFKLANDRESYSKAYSAQRKIIMADNFTLLFVGFITAVVLLSIFIAVKRRMPVKERSPYCYSSALRYSTKVIFRPASGFWDMKKEHYGRTSAAITILAVTTVLYAVFNSTKGFIFTSGVTEGNFFLELLTVIAPFFLFTICNWCVSNLMGGEGSYRYIFMGTSYALTPMVIILPVLMILSHVMTGEESGIYYLITGIMLIWTVILIVCANMEVHAYRMGKTLLVMFITIIVMIIIVFLIAFIAALAQQIIGVAGDMINEIYLRL